MVWNLKGFGSREHHSEFKQLLSEKIIEVFGILKTKLKLDKQQPVLKDFSDEWDVVTNIDMSNNSGRDSIWVSCKHAQWNINVLCTHCQFIQAQLENSGDYQFFITIVYGDNQAIVCEELWNEILALKAAHGDIHWILFENWNGIHCSNERARNDIFNQIGADAFNAAMDGLHELDSIGGMFT